MPTKKELFLQRLEEIHNTVLEELSDEQVLEILAERKQLTEEIALLEKEEQSALSKEAELKSQQEKLQREIALLNQEISPSKEDEELLRLIGERKKLEEALEKVEQSLKDFLMETKVSESSAPEKKEVAAEKVVGGISAEISEEALEEKSVAAPVSEEIEPAPLGEESLSESQSRELLFKDDVFGKEEIRLEESDSSEKFSFLLPQLESSRDSLGSFLQSVPEEARENTFFMLKVATIDPAYAMHYASGALLQDESFHIKIANMKNTRNTGNALAEMSPAMRTGAVVLAAVRHDFRNVRFALPAMPEYDEILTIAKKGALEKVRDLKEVVDLSVLIPKILQKDKAFMEAAKQVIQK